jgi:hypothetical protein
MTRHLWELIPFPLHFELLLFMAAMLVSIEK